MWKIAEAILDENTKKAIVFTGYDFEGMLKESVDLNVAPSFLGGNCKCQREGRCVYNMEDFASLHKEALKANREHSALMKSWGRSGATATGAGVVSEKDMAELEENRY
jgi:hypothetical protein